MSGADDDGGHCTCTSERDPDGAERGACRFHEQVWHEETFGDPDLLAALHAGPSNIDGPDDEPWIPNYLGEAS